MLDRDHVEAFDNFTLAARRYSEARQMDGDALTTLAAVDDAVKQIPVCTMGRALKEKMNNILQDANPTTIECIGHTLDALARAVFDAEWSRRLRETRCRRESKNEENTGEVKTILRGDMEIMQRLVMMLNACRNDGDDAWDEKDISHILENNMGTGFFLKIGKNGNGDSATERIGACALVSAKWINAKPCARVVAMEEVIPGGAEALGAHLLGRVPWYYTHIIYTGTDRRKQA